MPDDVLAPRPLGATGLLVPPLCVGCASLGDMPEAFTYAVDEEQLAQVRIPDELWRAVARMGGGELDA